jgi:tetratricopeptide (TPR) repeat protein
LKAIDCGTRRAAAFCRANEERKFMLKKAILMALVLVSLSLGANAQIQSTRVLAWDLGGNLGLAAVEYAENVNQAEVDFIFNNSAQAAKELGISLPPLPAKTEDKSENRKRVFKYLALIREPIHTNLENKYDRTHAALFDAALNLNKIMLFSAEEDRQFFKPYVKANIRVIDMSAALANLPGELFAEIIKLAESNADFALINEAVINTHGTVLEHLVLLDLIETGDFYAAKKEYATAVAEYTKAIQINKNFAEAYFKRGLAYDRLAQPDSAIADFTKVIELAAKDEQAARNVAGAYANRCMVYSGKRDYVRAVADCNEALKLKPDFGIAYLYRGDSNLNRGKNFQAALDYSKAIDIEPSFVAYHNRGLAYLRISEYRKAIADFTKAIELNGSIATAYYNRGLAYQAIGRTNLSKLDFEKAAIIRAGIVKE